MKILSSFFFLFLLLNSCKNVSTKKETEKESNKKKLVQKINFYAFDPIFAPYFPDTTAQFKNLRELENYNIEKTQAFTKFSANQKLKNDNTDSIILLVHSAQIEFYKRMEILFFKQLKKFPRDNASMLLLSYFSYTNGISMQERIDFFNTFPEKIKKNEIGKKTWNRIQKFVYDKNIGVDINQFDNLRLIDNSGTNFIFETLVNNAYPYYILVFGASWCQPCYLDEKQLKHWMPVIDTSKVKVIGLSIDSKKEKWLQYLKQESFPWKSYLMKNGENNKMMKKLHFKGIPMNFLINKYGKIVIQSPDIRSILLYLSDLN